MVESTRRKVLLFGKSGQVGACLSRHLKLLPQFELVEFDSKDVDLSDLERVFGCIEDIKPDWVINAAAYTAVDKAESDEDLCFRLNAQAPGRMAAACAKVGARFIHYSTDYVFDGNGTQSYVESDETNPQSVYGRSKRQGEITILEHLPESIIFRTAWVYAKEGHNFVNTMLRLASQLPEIRVVNDQFGSPTFAKDLSDMTINVVCGIESGNLIHQGGVFHATCKGETSWFGFCEQIMKVSSNSDTVITAIPSVDFPTDAPRPHYSVLCNRKLKQVYGQELPDWKTSLHRCLHPL